MAAPTVTVTLPKGLSKFDGRKLELDEMGYIQCYCENTSAFIDWKNAFDAGDYIGIVFYKHTNEKYSIWALHANLDQGPEFHVNKKDSSGYDANLRDIVDKHLQSHPEIGLTIEQFI